MSVARRLRRQEQKRTGVSGALGQIGQLHTALNNLKGLAESAPGVAGLVKELVELRDELREALDMRDGELERQRAVFLRMLYYDNQQPGVENFLATEQRYRAEYEAMLALIGLIRWAKEAP